jgi:hypothetical protein
VDALKVAGDGQLACDHRLDARAKCERNVVDRQHVLRRGHGHHDALGTGVGSNQRHGHIPDRKVGLEHRNHGRIGLVEVTLQGCGEAHLASQGFGNLIRGKESSLDKLSPHPTT